MQNINRRQRLLGVVIDDIVGTMYEFGAKKDNDVLFFRKDKGGFRVCGEPCMVLCFHRVSGAIFPVEIGLLKPILHVVENQLFAK